MSLIRNASFKHLDFLISSEGTIDNILKTMIFIDKIDNGVEIAK